MKKLEFETSKGRFLLIDSKDAPSSFNRYLRDIEKEFGVQLTTGYKLSEIAEEASGIVDSTRKNIREKDIVFQDYQSKYKKDFSYDTAIESLHSLLKSKGIHLFENPHADKIGITDFDYHRNKAEQKTFYNPYIFKL